MQATDSNTRYSYFLLLQRDILPFSTTSLKKTVKCTCSWKPPICPLKCQLCPLCWPSLKPGKQFLTGFRRSRGTQTSQLTVCQKATVSRQPELRSVWQTACTAADERKACSRYEQRFLLPPNPQALSLQLMFGHRYFLSTSPVQLIFFFLTFARVKMTRITTQGE